MRQSIRHMPLFSLLAIALTISGCASGPSNSFDPVSMDTPELDPAFPPTNVELSIPSAGAKMPAYLMIANGRGPHP
ncbi:MAG: hypothetical protein AAF270_16675, partial [Pseudomonadota bacterium]